MTAFPDWPRFAVPQKHEQTGCIPWSYEIMLRAAGVQGIDWTTFQEDFDLNRQAGSSVANFQNVADAVRKRYPDALVEAKGFATGAEKLAFVESRIQRQEPTVVSLAWEGLTNGAQRGWHMMPVVDADEQNLLLLCSVSAAGQATVIHRIEVPRRSLQSRMGCRGRRFKFAPTIQPLVENPVRCSPASPCGRHQSRFPV